MCIFRAAAHADISHFFEREVEPLYRKKVGFVACMLIWKAKSAYVFARNQGEINEKSTKSIDFRKI